MYYLMISGIQHFIFCRRQWALIHVEKLWKENVRTFKGHEFHGRVDDPYIFEKRGDIIVSRSLPLVSHELFLNGVADCVEFHKRKDDLGAKVKDRDGTYDIIPIEYKVGDLKSDESDISQLCVQAICLEEMFGVRVEKGYIYYGKSRKRFEVTFTNHIIDKVKCIVNDMRCCFESGLTPLLYIKNHAEIVHCMIYVCQD